MQPDRSQVQIQPVPCFDLIIRRYLHFICTLLYRNCHNQVIEFDVTPNGQFLVNLMNFLINMPMTLSWFTTKFQPFVHFDLQFNVLIHCLTVCSRLCSIFFFLMFGSKFKVTSYIIDTVMVEFTFNLICNLLYLLIC